MGQGMADDTFFSCMDQFLEWVLVPGMLLVHGSHVAQRTTMHNAPDPQLAPNRNPRPTPDSKPPPKLKQTKIQIQIKTRMKAKAKSKSESKAVSEYSTPALHPRPNSTPQLRLRHSNSKTKSESICIGFHLRFVLARSPCCTLTSTMPSTRRAWSRTPH